MAPSEDWVLPARVSTLAPFVDVNETARLCRVGRDLGGSRLPPENRRPDLDTEHHPEIMENRKGAAQSYGRARVLRRRARKPCTSTKVGSTSP